MIIDIETIPSGKKLTLEEVKIPGNIKKEDSKEKWLKENGSQAIEEEYRRRSLIPHKCQVVCWAIKDDLVEDSCFDLNEKVLMERLNESLKKAYKSPYEIVWSGVNIRLFDMVILRQRAFKFGLVSLASSIPDNSYSDRIVDVMDVFTGSKSKDYLVSKDDMCKFFGIEIEDEGDGSLVYNQFLNKEYDKILHHCKADVDKEFELCKKMNL